MFFGYAQLDIKFFFPPKLKPNFSISCAANWYIKVVPEESTEGKKR